MIYLCLTALLRPILFVGWKGWALRRSPSRPDEQNHAAHSTQRHCDARRSHIFSPFRSQLYFLDFAEA
jgi:hypothetical protein